MKILFTKYFITHYARLEKKLPNLKEDLLKALKAFDEKTAVSMGSSVYKIRIKSSDLNKGKSGGLRCYIYFFRQTESLVPFCIYLKSEDEDIPRDILKIHMQLCIKKILKK